MRRLGDVRLDAVQLHRFHRVGLALDFPLQAFEQFALLDDHAIQLLELVFEVGTVQFQFLKAPGLFIRHGPNLPQPAPFVELAAANPTRGGAKPTLCHGPASQRLSAPGAHLP